MTPTASTISWRAVVAAGAVLAFLAAFAIRVPHPQWQLLVGLCTVVWGPETKTNPVRLFPSTAVRCRSRPCHLPGTDFSVNIGVDQLAIVLVVACLSLALYLFFQRTVLGVRVRAVVDS